MIWLTDTRLVYAEANWAPKNRDLDKPTRSEIWVRRVRDLVAVELSDPVTWSGSGVDRNWASATTVKFRDGASVAVPEPNYQTEERIDDLVAALVTHL